jgi:hypothetical protein
MGEVFNLGHKSTKHMPFRYRQSPVHDMSSFSYTNDYSEKPSDSGLNAVLADMFSRKHQGWVGSPTVAPGNYALDYVKHPKHILDAMGQPRKAGGGGRGQAKRDMARTQVISCSDLTHVTKSSSHRFYRAVPEHMKPDVTKQCPVDNLGQTGVDGGDCYKSTYGTHFRGLAPANAASSKLNRCHTAPANMSRKEAREQQKELELTLKPVARPSTSSEQLRSDRQKSIRNIFSRTGN